RGSSPRSCLAHRWAARAGRTARARERRDRRSALRTPMDCVVSCGARDLRPRARGSFTSAFGGPPDRSAAPRRLAIDALSAEDGSLVEAVVFDLGETLVDEPRVWGEWADALGIPRLTFFAALGALIERDRPHLEVFELFRPELDVRAARR